MSPHASTIFVIVYLSLYRGDEAILVMHSLLYRGDVPHIQEVGISSRLFTMATVIMCVEFRQCRSRAKLNNVPFGSENSCIVRSIGAIASVGVALCRGLHHMSGAKLSSNRRRTLSRNAWRYVPPRALLSAGGCTQCSESDARAPLVPGFSCLAIHHSLLVVQTRWTASDNKRSVCEIWTRASSISRPT